MESPLCLTPLNEIHLDTGGRMVQFAGWMMPVQFKGIVDEHQAVRHAVGIFDISHMGQFWLRGPGAAEFLDSKLTNHAGVLEDQQGQYTLMLNEKGGVLDDLIIYRMSEQEWFLVVNASRVSDDFARLNENLPPELTLENTHGSTAGFAVQGPKALEVWDIVFPNSTLPGRNGIAFVGGFGREPGVVCRTGYTGEDGFEWFCTARDAPFWYKKFLNAVTENGGLPCGLGSRDSLRLEMAYPLYGNDLDEFHTPIQAGLSIFVNLKKVAFPGLDTLRSEKRDGPKVRLTALTLDSLGPPPRHGYPVLYEGESVGVLASGGHSPALGKGIAMAYLPAALSKEGTSLQIEIRGRSLPATVVKKPFHKKPL